MEEWVRHTNAKGYVYETNDSGEVRWVNEAVLNEEVRREYAQEEVETPTPSAWQMCWDESGFAYYTNGAESYWANDETIWSEATDEEGNTYYINNLTSESSWAPPPSTGISAPEGENAGHQEYHQQHTEEDQCEDEAAGRGNRHRRGHSPRKSPQQEQGGGIGVAETVMAVGGVVGGLFSATTQCELFKII
jgi:hypothetical protein